MLGLVLLPLLCAGLFVAAFNDDDNDPDSVDVPDPDVPDPDVSDDVISGTAGDDLLSAVGSETVNGGGGNDSLYAMSGSDGAVLNGDDGDDQIFGSGENATLHGGAGNDTIESLGVGSDVSGGDGDDSIMAAHPDQTLSGGIGNDTITYDFGSGAGSTTVSGDAGDDLIELVTSQFSQDGTAADGGLGNDTIRATVLANEPLPGQEHTLTGGEGSDLFEVILQPSDPDTSDGVALGVLAHITDFEADADRLIVDISEFSVFQGIFDAPPSVNYDLTESEDGSYTDVNFQISSPDADGELTGTLRLEGVNGLSADDISFSTTPSAANGVLDGTPDPDLLTADGSETVNGGDGNDSLTASDTSDGAVLNGDGGGDDLRAGGNAPTLNGGEGSDSLYSGDAVDAVLNGQAGGDFFGIMTDQNLEANGGTGDDQIEAFIEGGDVRLNGGGGDDDFIVGGTGGIVHGDAGDDSIYVESAQAEVYGDAGADNIGVRVVLDDEAAGAASILSGGEGADSFSINLFDPARPAETESADLGIVTRIADFDPQEDNLVLDLRESGSQVNTISTVPGTDAAYLDVIVDVTASATGPAQSFTVRLDGVSALDADQIVIREPAAAGA